MGAHCSMLKWRVFLVLVLIGTTMPESMRLAEYCCFWGTTSQSSRPDHSAPCPDVPAPWDGEASKWLEADSLDDHEGSFFLTAEFHPLWRPALSAGGRGLYATSRDLFDSLHRLRI
jgi:hypothetical protein